MAGLKYEAEAADAAPRRAAWSPLPSLINLAAFDAMGGELSFAAIANRSDHNAKSGPL